MGLLAEGPIGAPRRIKISVVHFGPFGAEQLRQLREAGIVLQDGKLHAGFPVTVSLVQALEEHAPFFSR